MTRHWTELWSAGRGVARTCCGVARTPEGYMVDLFEGDRCVRSQLHPSRQGAVRQALALEREYLRQRRRPGRLPRRD